MVLYILAGGRCHTDDVEAVACIFKAFVLPVGQGFEWQRSVATATPLHVRKRVTDFVSVVLYGCLWRTRCDVPGLVSAVHHKNK